MKRWFLLLGLFSAAHAQDVPLQRADEREVTRRQSQEVFDVLRPVARAASHSAVWVWAGGRPLAVGTVVGDGTQVLTKWSEIALVRGALQCVGGDGTTASASVLGVYVDEDLAMLQLDGAKFAPVIWSQVEAPTTGSFLVAVSPNDEPFAMGVVSVDARSLRESDQAFLGVLLDQEYRGDGVKVASVDNRGGADEAGVRDGDILLEVAGVPVSGSYELRNILLQHEPGERVKVKILRTNRRANTDKTLELDIELGERPDFGGIPEGRLNAMRRMGGPISEVGDGFPLAVQTDMQLKKEQCGGPVVDLRGRTVGLAIARTDRTRSFIIPASEIVTLLGQKPVAPNLAQLDREAPRMAAAEGGVRRRAVPMNPRAADELRQHLEEMQSLLERLDREMESIGE